MSSTTTVLSLLVLVGALAMMGVMILTGTPGAQPGAATPATASR